MAQSKNYLLGYGERLTEPLEPPRLRPSKKHHYTFIEARARLSPRIASVAEEVEQLPKGACPENNTVAVLTLHPAYLAKSYFPLGLLQTVGLEAVGSRSRQIRPEKGAKPVPKGKGLVTEPKSPTAEIFVAASRPTFRRWASAITRWHEGEPGHDEIIRLEDVRWIPPEERLRPMLTKTDLPLLEVVLHATDDYILEGFRDYLRSLDVKVNLDRRIQVQGLCFLPVRVPRAVHIEMAKYSFLRIAREMPRLRELSPIRATSVKGFSVELPKGGALNADLKVAVFDGGLPKNSALEPWVSRKKGINMGEPVPEFQEHGLGVTSALLFGPLAAKIVPDVPFAMVDHYRVLDESTRDDPQDDYFDVLERVTAVLTQKKYEFVNLSIGPDIPIEDDEVHVWTAQLDQLFADGQTLVTVAAGNSGERDRASGNARIQAPADGVNVVGVGASDSIQSKWKRAPYSSLGPGRNPGIIKPDILAFGGCGAEPFWVVSRDKPGYSNPITGTSFAAPHALRTAIGVRAHLGSVIKPIALKALLVHHSRDSGHDSEEVGWGRIPSAIDDLITCGPGEAHIVYQGELEPGKYIRARIPLPKGPLKGQIEISATFCYASETDPEDPVNYTRAGLDIKFRPDRTKRTPGKDGKVPHHADTDSFFKLKALYNTEEELRRDAHQWETSVKRTRKFRPSSLNEPTFDIHYNARRSGHKYLDAKPIPYALIVSVRAMQMPDLYDQIFLRYRNSLEPLRPVLQVPIRVV